MDLTRRNYLKAKAAAVAAAAAGAPLPADAANVVLPGDEARLTWSKAPCRFCGTGCGVMVAVRDNKVVATHGDIHAEVNRGLNCVKGYFLSKILYGSDRLTQPLLRMKDGQYDKNGEFEPVSWERAFDEMAAQWKRVLKEKGPTAVGMFGSGQWTVWEGYAALKLMKGGFRSNNLDPNARHCMASAAYGFMRSFGMDEPMGCYDDIEAADAFVLWGSNMAEMHPILWTRIADRRLSNPHVKVAVLSTFEHRSFDLADIPIVFTPQTDLAMLNFIANHIITTGRVNQDFVAKHVNFKLGATDIGYGLRPEHPLEQKAANAKAPGDAKPISFDDFAKFVSSLRSREHGEADRRAGDAPRGVGRALCRPQDQGDVAVDHGLQPAYARRMGQQHGLQPPPSHRKDLRARQFAVLADRAALGLRHGAGGRHVRASPAGRHGGDQPRAPQARRGDLEAAARHHRCRDRLSRGATEPHAARRQAQRLLGAGQQQHAGGGQPQRRDLSRLSQCGELRRGLRRLSDRHGAVRRSHPAQRHVGREGRRLRQCRAQDALLASAGDRAGRVEVGPLAAGRVLEALHHRRGLAGRAARHRARAQGQDALRGAVRQRQRRPVPRRARSTPPTRMPKRRPSASICRKDCSRNMPASGAGTATTWRRSTPTTRRAACAGRWSTARRPGGATAKGSIPMSRRGQVSNSTVSPTRRR